MSINELSGAFAVRGQKPTNKTGAIRVPAGTLQAGGRHHAKRADSANAGAR